MSKIDKFKKENNKLYEISQILIEICESISNAMKSNKVDLLELSYRTKLSELELENYIENYADMKIGTLFKIADALDLNVKIVCKKTK